MEKHAIPITIIPGKGEVAGMVKGVCYRQVSFISSITDAVGFSCNDVNRIGKW